MTFKTFKEKLWTNALYILEHAEPNIPIMGLFGLVGFPLFHFVWEYVFPQDFESLTFRLLIALLSVPWVFYHSIPRRLRSLFPIYLIVSIWIMIPIFFCFMLLKNEWSMVWAMSTFAGLFLLILLINNWLLVTTLTVSGYLVASYAVFLVDGRIGFAHFHPEYIPVLLFGIVGSIIFSHKKHLANLTKFSLLHSLSGSIAHEMRNPLNAIINAMGSLQSMLPSKPGTKEQDPRYTLSRSGLISLHNVVEESTETVLRANKIIDSILAGMLGKSVDPKTFKRTSAKNSIHHAISSYSYASPEDRQLVTIAAKKDFDFFGDNDLFIYVLFNLIKNALYYKDKPGFSIEISTDRTEDYNIVRVRDTGPGIPAGKLERIFDSFYTSGKEGGVGLGLAFCKRVINSFGGEITCRSREHEWTEFILSLPLYDSRESEQLKQEVLQEKNILVVDDSQANRFIAAKFLADRNCQVTQAENGVQALSILSRKTFDLILMDIEMPLMKGDEAARRIREGKLTGKTPVSTVDCRGVPIVGVSALSGGELRERTIGAGMDGFIPKPVTKESIESVLEKYFFSEREPVDYSDNFVPEGVKILVVDDNLTSRKYMSAILERMGADVSQAENGEDAIQCIEQTDYDIVFLDMEMPVLNGVDTARKIREGSCFSRFRKFREIPIVALTGNTDAKDIALTRRSGMNAHLGKPVSREELVKTLSFWLQ